MYRGEAGSGARRTMDVADGSWEGGLRHRDAVSMATAIPTPRRLLYRLRAASYRNIAIYRLLPPTHRVTVTQ